MSYVGLGPVQFWAGEKLLELDDLDQPTKGPMEPLVLPWTCYLGLFDHPSYPSLAGSIVRAEGKGAIASWAPGGLGTLAAHQVLATGF